MTMTAVLVLGAFSSATGSDQDGVVETREAAVENLAFPDHDGGQVKRQGVDDWTTSQVVLWLRKQGISPWNQEVYSDRVEEHGLDGQLLLAHRAKDILAVLEPDQDPSSPIAQQNLQRLEAGLGALLQSIKESPVDFWEFRLAHRRSAALLQAGLSLAPRATVLYMLINEREALFLIVGPQGLSLLAFLTLLLFPHLAVAFHIWHVTPHAPLLAWSLLCAHLLSFFAALLSTRASGSLSQVAWGAVKVDLGAMAALHASRFLLHYCPWWVVDCVLFASLALQVCLAMISSVTCRQKLEELALRVLYPARGRRFYKPSLRADKHKPLGLASKSKAARR